MKRTNKLFCNQCFYETIFQDPNIVNLISSPFILEVHIFHRPHFKEQASPPKFLSALDVDSYWVKRIV